jgi:hypothetical protein
MSENVVEIHVMLLNEEFMTARATKAKALANGMYEVLRPDDYDPEDEEWEFVPGTIVRCEWQPKGWQKPLLMAVEKVA